MTIPAFIFGFIISSLYGAAFHLIRGGKAQRFLLYLILGWLGFWAGQFIAAQLNLSFLDIGPLHIGMATIGSLLFLLVGNWLSLVDTEKK
jgi:hypothetical protein